MIVDCHAHVFRHWSGNCGHPSRHEHLRYVQQGVTRPAARVFKAKDGARVAADALFRGKDNSWRGLTDVDFRVGRFGQLDFTVNGEDYYVQYYPVGMQEIEAPPELMLAQMTYAGVDHAILQAGATYGLMNDYNAFAQNQYPTKFTGLMYVDGSVAHTPEALRELDRAHGRLGLKALYFNLEGFARVGYRWSFDDPRLEPFWAQVAALKIPIVIELSSDPSDSERDYLENLRRLDRLLRRHRDTQWLLAMGPPVSHFARDGKWAFPDEVAATYGLPNLRLEVTFPITWGGVWDYPYREAQALIRDARDQFGVAKLVWGSDMPNVERFCTYEQSLAYISRYCAFLSASEKDLILGGNAAELFGLTDSAAHACPAECG